MPDIDATSICVIVGGVLAVALLIWFLKRLLLRHLRRQPSMSEAEFIQHEVNKLAQQPGYSPRGKRSCLGVVIVIILLLLLALAAFLAYTGQFEFHP